MKNDRNRFLTYDAVNKLPQNIWFSFGELCQIGKINPKSLGQFLKELKNQGKMEHQTSMGRTNGGWGIWHSYWKRTCDE